MNKMIQIEMTNTLNEIGLDDKKSSEIVLKVAQYWEQLTGSAEVLLDTIESEVLLSAVKWIGENLTGEDVVATLGRKIESVEKESGKFVTIEELLMLDDKSKAILIFAAIGDGIANIRSMLGLPAMAVTATKEVKDGRTKDAVANISSVASVVTTDVEPVEETPKEVQVVVATKNVETKTTETVAAVESTEIPVEVKEEEKPTESVVPERSIYEHDMERALEVDFIRAFAEEGHLKALAILVRGLSLPAIKTILGRIEKGQVRAKTMADEIEKLSKESMARFPEGITDDELAAEMSLIKVKLLELKEPVDPIDGGVAVENPEEVVKKLQDSFKSSKPPKSSVWNDDRRGKKQRPDIETEAEEIQDRFDQAKPEARMGHKIRPSFGRERKGAKNHQPNLKPNFSKREK